MEAKLSDVGSDAASLSRQFTRVSLNEPALGLADSSDVVSVLPSCLEAEKMTRLQLLFHLKKHDLLSESEADQLAIKTRVLRERLQEHIQMMCCEDD